MFSPFSDEGSTPSPLTAQSNVNVLIGGSNLLAQNERFSYQTFQRHLDKARSLNSNLTDSLVSGTIDQEAFEMLYNYQYYILDRVPSDAERAVPKSIQVQGENLCKKSISLMVFVCYEQEVTIDALTGQRVA
jgi:hypothetical protein